MNWTQNDFRVACPDIAKKLCGGCFRAMSYKDRHEKCQKCRKSGGYLMWPGKKPEETEVSERWRSIIDEE
jgi:hypothetical protein